MPVSEPEKGNSAAERLENLWRGSFGDDYTERNSEAGEKRATFWSEILSKFPSRRILEVGCNLGGNLKWLAQLIPPRDVYGIEINEGALGRLRTTIAGVNALWGRARELPFRDRFFDLVFTSGVLIHQPPDILPVVMAEIVRCSRRYVLAAEYFAESPTEVPYRGQREALFKRDFGSLYALLFPELRVLEKGFLGPDRGWIDVTYWVFERSE